MTPKSDLPVEFRVQELLAKQSPPLSQSELARRAGVSLTTVNAMALNKTRQVSLETLQRVSSALGVSAGELISTPQCSICHQPAIDQEKVADRSLYQVWCSRCGVYFIGGLSKAQLSSLAPEAQRLPLATAIHAANARGLVGVVWGHPVPDEKGALDAIADEIVDRFAMICDGHLLDCTRDIETSGWGAPTQPSKEWIVRVDGEAAQTTGVNAMNATKAQAARKLQAWFKSRPQSVPGARKHR